MIYKVYNPTTGQHETAVTKEEAIETQNRIKNELVMAAYPSIIDDSHYKDDLNIAINYAVQNLSSETCSYLYTETNLSTGLQISNLFETNNGYWIKISNRSVVELYKVKGLFEDKERSFVSIDLSTHNPIEYYELGDDNVLVKYSLSGEPLRRYENDPSLIPTEFAPLYANFEHKQVFEFWVVKPEGLIVGTRFEYFKPQELLTEQDLAFLQTKRQQVLTETQDWFVINRVEIDELGNETWLPADDI